MVQGLFSSNDQQWPMSKPVQDFLRSYARTLVELSRRRRQGCKDEDARTPHSHLDEPIRHGQGASVLVQDRSRLDEVIALIA